MSKIQSKFSGAFSAEVDDLTNYLRQQSDIKLAILFGSLATGKARSDSDIDIGIQKTHPLSASEKDEVIGQLALITGRSVDLVDLSVAGEPILGQILKCENYFRIT